MAHPDFELRRGPSSILLTELAFLPSVISSFFTQNKGEERPPPPRPSPISATEEGTVNAVWCRISYINRSVLASI